MPFKGTYVYEDTGEEFDNEFDSPPRHSSIFLVLL